MKMTLIAILLAAAGTTGCASIDSAGHASYTVKATKAGDGSLACCELEVKDGKEFSGRNVMFQTNGSGAVLQVQEGESKAFKGQAIGAKALSVMPVNLGDVLK